MFDEVLVRINIHSRFVLCGGISSYEIREFHPLHNRMSLNIKRVLMEGFVRTDYEKRFPEAARILTDRLAHDGLKQKEDVAIVLENARKTLLQLFRGENFDSRILKTAEIPLPLSA
ncbi:MAG: hypothetical protein M1351_00675 [Candidatus Thermoplasmatota archaeon]|nr:hypothetical protein [Candidatus Thermoplasmatota archaeon]